MESIEEVQKNIHLIDKKLKDFFPSTIKYPGQEILNSNENNNNPTKDSKSNHDKFSNVEKFEINREYKQIFFYDEKDDTSLHPINEVFIKGNLIIACGDKFVKVYDKNNLDEAEYIFQDPDEEFHTFSFSEVEQEDGSILNLVAVGGKAKIIKIIDLLINVQINQLIGHRNKIMDLKFCPVKGKSHQLLSGSEDFSIRLWNAITGIQICIFAGPFGGHNADVLSVDWHLSGKYFVSSGVDYYIKIWQINQQIENNDILSKTKNLKKFKTIISSIPLFSCNSIHENYVDCVKFNGNFVLSKSVDGVIYEWQPIFNQEPQSFFIINTYCFSMKSQIWYMKFDIDPFVKKLVAVGNDQGTFYIFSLVSEVIPYYHGDYSFKQPTLDQLFINDGKNIEDNGDNGETLVRCVYLDRTSNSYILGHDNGKITIGEFKRKYSCN